MKNPFHAQGPTEPRYYADRKLLLDRFKRNVLAVAGSDGVTKPTNLAIVGKWGIGKSSTLRKFGDILAKECRDAHAFCAFVDLKPSACDSSDAFSQYLLNAIYREMELQLPPKAKAQRFIEDELGRWRITKLSLNPQIERKEKLVRAVGLRESLNRVWKKLRENGFKIAVIMLDDIHYPVTEGKGHILLDLRTDLQNLPADQARFMFITTSPENVQPAMKDGAEPFTRLFEKHVLEPFDFDGTREMILKPIEAEKLDLAFDKDVISRIHEFTGGHPYFISLIVKEVVDQMPSGKITSAKFNELYPDLMAYLASAKFNEEYDRATESEREVLRKLANSDKEVIPLSQIGRPSAKFVERLVDKELVIRMDRGQYKLYHKLFKEYLLRRCQKR